MHRATRWVGIALCFAFSCAAVPTLVYGLLERGEIEAPNLALDLVPALEKRLQKFASGRGPRPLRVAFLGDSTALGEPPRRAVPARLERRANGLAPTDSAIQVVSLAFPGLGPVDYYWLADLVSEATPDQVVLVFNAATLSRHFARRLTRPELAGWVSPGRLPEALMMPLGWIDVRADELLFHAAMVQTGRANSWHRVRAEQARVGEGRRQLERALEARGGRKGATARYDERVLEVQFEQLEQSATDHSGLRVRYGPALDGIDVDHPVLVILSGAVRAFHHHGVAPIVYFAPIDVEALERVGLHDVAGLAHTVESLASAVEGSGGVFVDLHALLPSDTFRDAQGHYASGAEVDGPEQIAAALAPFIAANARGTTVSPR